MTPPDDRPATGPADPALFAVVMAVLACGGLAWLFYLLEKSAGR